MDQLDNLLERSRLLLVDTEQSAEKMLLCLKATSTEIDSELLEKIIAHHLHRSQESIMVLCKLLEVYQRGELNNAFLLMLSQWT